MPGDQYWIVEAVFIAAAMVYAAFLGKLESIKCLKELGAKLDVKRENGNTPLDDAIKKGFTEVAEWLKLHKL